MTEEGAHLPNIRIKSERDKVAQLKAEAPLSISQLIVSL